MPLKYILCLCICLLIYVLFCLFIKLLFFGGGRERVFFGERGLAGEDLMLATRWPLWSAGLDRQRATNLGQVPLVGFPLVGHFSDFLWFLVVSCGFFWFPVVSCGCLWLVVSFLCGLVSFQSSLFSDFLWFPSVWLPWK